MPTSAWKPEIAPQAMVMKTNGKSLPGMIGPAAAGELRDRRRVDVRRHDDGADDQRGDRAELHVRREVVARAEQHPDRQHRGDEAVDGDGDR